MLANYQWPGNIRELQNCIERTLISARNPLIEAVDLPPYLSQRPPVSEHTAFPLELDKETAAFERRQILAALEKAEGVQVRAAELLGINERSLWHRLKKYGIAVSKSFAPRVPGVAIEDSIQHGFLEIPMDRLLNTGLFAKDRQARAIVDPRYLTGNSSVVRRRFRGADRRPADRSTCRGGPAHRPRHAARRALHGRSLHCRAGQNL